MKIDVTSVVFLVIICAPVWVAVRRLPLRPYPRVFAFILLLAGLVWFGVFVAVPGLGVFYRSFFVSRELFGRSFYIPGPRISYEDRGLFELYSVEVFDLPEELAKWASAPPSEFATNYPKAKSGRYWKRVTWHRTPAGSEYHTLLQLIEEGYDDSPGWEQAAKAEKLRQQLMSEPGNYFAFRYWDEGSDPIRVQFCVLSPSRHMLILGFYP